MTAKGSKSNITKMRKRVEAVESTVALKRARDGSAFAKCSCALASEAQVVEINETKKKPAEKKKIPTKKAKKDKDPNMPKRPPTAFFIFMEEFRKSFKEANPDNKSVSEVAKKGGEVWQSKTDEGKKQYVEKARELKAEYEKAIEAYKARNVVDEAGSDNETEVAGEAKDEAVQDDLEEE